MPESLLAILKLCAVALLYLFFLRVLRAVWAEVSPARAGAAPARQARPRARAASRKPRGGGPALVLVEPKDRAGQSWPLGDEVTLGRASGCSVALEDGYASQLHARLFRHGDGLQVEDLGSTNGTYVNGRRVTAPTPLTRGDQLRIGATVFEVRL